MTAMRGNLVNRPSMEEWDVLVVGGGVSGLACATELRRRGVGRVAIIERELQPGGAPRHIRNRSFGWLKYKRPMLGPAFAHKLVNDALQAGVEIVTSASVVGLDNAGGVRVTCANGVIQLSARQVCLASGARETTRHGHFISGARPFGITTTGALQRFIHFQSKTPFSRPLVVGTEWVALSALQEMRAAGIKAAAMINPWRETSAPRWLTSAACRVMGVPLLTETRLARILGRTRVEGAMLDVQGSQQELACDGVLFTGSFLPEAHLVQMAGLGFDPGTRGPVTDDLQRICDSQGAPTALVACGNALRGVKGSGPCLREGERAARTMAESLAGSLSRETCLPVTAGEGLAYARPQMVAGQRMQEVTFQAMATEPKRACLVLRADGEVVAEKNVNAAPGRVMEFKPSVPLAKDPAGLELSLEERA